MFYHTIQISIHPNKNLLQIFYGIFEEIIKEDVCIVARKALLIIFLAAKGVF